MIRRRRRASIESAPSDDFGAGQPALAGLEPETRRRFIEALAEVLVADLLKHPPGRRPRSKGDLKGGDR